MTVLPIKHVFSRALQTPWGTPKSTRVRPRPRKASNQGRKRHQEALFRPPAKTSKFGGSRGGPPAGGLQGPPPRGPKSVQVRIQNAVLPIKHVYSGHPERSFTDKTPVLPIKHVFWNTELWVCSHTFTDKTLVLPIKHVFWTTDWTELNW